MPPVLSKPSREKWQKYERRSMAKQQEFMERYKDDFDKVPVTNSDTIKVGDHLVLGRKYYDHHTLCTSARGDNQVVVIHHSGPALGQGRSRRKNVSRNLWNNRFVLKVKLFNTKIPQSSALLPLRSCRSFYCCWSVQRFSKSSQLWSISDPHLRRNENKTASNWFSKTATLYVLFGPNQSVYLILTTNTDSKVYIGHRIGKKVY